MLAQAQPEAKHGRWSAEENAFLLENHMHMTRRQIGVRLGRTKNSVCGQCFRMGLFVDADETERRRRTTQPKTKAAHMKGRGFPFTPEIDARIIQLYFVEGYSGELTAEMVGINKKQLQRRLKKIAPGRAKTTRPTGSLMRAGSGPPRKPRLSLVRTGAEPTVENGVTLLALNGNTCRMPIGAATGWAQVFCGQPVIIGRPYCSWCACDAYEPARKPYGRR